MSASFVEPFVFIHGEGNPSWKKDAQCIVDGEHAGFGATALHVPGAELFEIGEARIAVQAPACLSGVAEEVEVVAHEPLDPIGDEAREQIGADLVVTRVAGSNALAYVVEEGRGPHFAVIGGGAGEVEHLERMEERVAFGMITRRLLDAIEGEEKIMKLVVHLP